MSKKDGFLGDVGCYVQNNAIVEKSYLQPVI